jgi:hypothetical protein
MPPNQELRDLVAQAVAIEYLEYCKGAARKREESDEKPIWLQLFNSAGFAALVTVLLGGLAGGIITYKLQEYAKARESQAAQIRLDHDRELTAFAQHLDRERKVVEEMFSKLGKFVDASRDLTTLSRKEFCEECGSSRLPKRVITEKEDVVKKYNDATIDWNSNRLRLSMLLQLEHNNDGALLEAWNQTSNAAEAYAECADRWRTKYDRLEFHEALRACTQVRDSLNEATQAFTKRIVDLRKSSALPLSQDRQ